MGKRRSIRATARATGQLAAYADRDELVARGLLPATASVADAQALRRRMARDEQGARRDAVRREEAATASPAMSMVVAVVLTGPLLALAIGTGSGVWWFFTAVVGLSCMVAVFSACGAAETRRAAARAAGTDGAASTPR